MKIFSLILLCLAVGFGAAYLILPDGGSNGDMAAASGEKQLYTCGMHPEIVTDEPGECPICHMKLTPKSSGGGTAGSITIDPTTRQNMGLVTTAAVYRPMTRSVHTFGKIEIPDPNRHRVTLRVDGWIERLFVAEEGETVFKGQPLLEIYSPDLVAAQRELLVALQSGNATSSLTQLVRAAEERLANWNISEDQIVRLKETGDVMRTVTIRSPVTGYVNKAMVAEGDRVSARTMLYEIVDLSTVWVEAFVYEQDLPYVSEGLPAEIEVAGLPGELLTGRVAWVSPVLDAKDQAELRLRLDNPDGRLRPQMYAEVTLANRLDEERLAVPRRAVINSGTRSLLYVASAEDRYEPRTIMTGAVDDHDYVEVREGRTSGERVVVSGQFLLDSESRLSEPLNGDGGSGHQHHSHGDPHAQETGNKETESAGKDPYNTHTCPMPSHFHVLNYGPGTCDECGMDLVPVTETENKPVYVCPMPECGTVTRKPGSCPVCNMNLMEYKPEPEEANDDQATGQDTTVAADPYDIHTCPMPSHFHVLNYGPGKCDECGMDLAPVTETENKPVYVCPMPECGTVTQKPGSCPVCNMNLMKYEPEMSDDHSHH